MRRFLTLISAFLAIAPSAQAADYGNTVQLDGRMWLQTIGSVTAVDPAVDGWAYLDYYFDSCNDSEPPFAETLIEYEAVQAFFDDAAASVSGNPGSAGGNAITYPMPSQVSPISFAEGLGSSAVQICTDASQGLCWTLIAQHSSRSSASTTFVLTNPGTLHFSAYVDFLEIQSPCGLTMENPPTRYQALVYHVELAAARRDFVAHANSVSGVPPGGIFTSVTPPNNPDQYLATGQSGTILPAGTTRVTGIAVGFRSGDYDLSGNGALDCADVVLLRRLASAIPPDLTLEERRRFNFDGSAVGTDPTISSIDAYHLMTIASEVVQSCKRGDANGNGLANCCDKEMLVALVMAGPVLDGQAGYDVRLDIDMNGQLDGADVTAILPLLPPRFGDANRDCLVNFQDISDVLAVFGTAVGAWNKGDANGDGLANFQDISDILASFGAPACPS